METEFIRDTQETEHRFWIGMFKEASKVFNLTEEELNQDKYKNFFKMVERWAWADRMRREELSNPEEYKGCLWNGEEIS